MGKTKVSRAGQARVSQKIRKLIHEGYGPKQAAAIAYKMEHEHQLGPRRSTSRLRRRSRNRRLLLDRGGRKRNPGILSQDPMVNELVELAEGAGFIVVEAQAKEKDGNFYCLITVDKMSGPNIESGKISDSYFNKNGIVPILKKYGYEQINRSESYIAESRKNKKVKFIEIEAVNVGGNVRLNPMGSIDKPFALIRHKRFGGRPMKVYAIFIHPNKEWIWIILSRIPKNSPIIQMALVRSPVTPHGELGSVYKAEIEHFVQLGREYLKDVLPDDWEIVSKS